MNFDKVRNIGILLIYLFFQLQAFASVPVFNFTGTEELKLNNKLKVFEDQDATFSVQEVILSDSLFTGLDNGIANYGHTNSVVWAKFSVVNNADFYPILVLRPEWVPHAHVFIVKNHAIINECLLGAVVSSENRVAKISAPNVALQISKGETVDVYVKFESSHIINFNLSLSNPEFCYYTDKSNNVFFYIFLGFLACVLVYNFVLSISSKGINNIYFTLFIISTMLSSAYIKGFQPEILGAYMVNHSNIISSFMMIFLTESIYQFTNLQKISTRLSKFRWLILSPLMLGIFLNIINEIRISNIIVIELSFLGAIWGLLVAVVLYRNSEKGAGIIFAGFFSFILGGILHVLTLKCLVPLNMITSNSYVLGSGVQVLFFSFYIARKVAYIRKQKEEAQQRAVKEIKKNEVLILEQKAVLEQKVEERTLQLQVQNKEIRNKNKSITDGITYASYIQNAHLQNPSGLKKIAQDGFIFYQPKDILSGDFYFFTEIGELQFYIVADCTGHGVPGALLSITGHSLLREIIFLEKTIKPNEIISKLNTSFYKVLRQEDNANKDGMDIAVVVVDNERKKLMYAGAMNPLVYVQDNELNIIKGNRYSVGGDRHDLEFTLHEVDINEGLTFFLYSDGYQDQFNHADGSKFKGRILRELLYEVANWQGREQYKKLEDTFLNWKGDSFQTDDVLVMGVRIK